MSRGRERAALAFGAVLLAASTTVLAPVPRLLAARKQAQGAGQDTLAIEHATVLPMDRDTALADHTVLVSRDRVVWVGPARHARVPRAARRVDLVWRERVAAGALLGPRIFTSGPTVTGPSLFDWDREFVTVRTTRDAERVVRGQARAGYDMVKVHSRLTVPAYQRLLEVARETGMPVVGHVIPKIGLARTLAAGQVSLEHAELGLFDGDETRLDEGARAIARTGAWVGTIVSARDGRCGPPTEVQRRIVAALRRANVRLLAGTDASLGPLRPGAALHCELATLVRAGLTPYEALVTATRNAGAFARTHLKERVPFGTVTAGARADLVLLPADPRADIRAVARPIGTVLRGAWRPR